MRAALLTDYGHPLTVVDDVEIEGPRPGEVLVRVTHCGLCHSDVSLTDGTFKPPVPVILGHEAAGIVADVGAGVTRVKAGDKVLLSPIPACGQCYWCLRGEYGICVNGSSIGSNTFPDGTTGLSRHGETVWRGVGLGAFAEYALVTDSAVVPVGADTPLDVVCVIGCSVQTGVGAVINTAKVPEGATVLVMGLGGIGISIVQGARLAGAARIIVSDPVSDRRDAAARFGATDAIDPVTQDVTAEVMRITGVGADYAFDAVGRSALVETGVWSTRSGGTTVVVGAAPGEQVVSLPAVLITALEKKIMGSMLGGSNARFEIPRLVSLWKAGRLDLEAMVTKRRPLGEINEAIGDMQAGRGIRTVLEI
jgi:Zn-dependent alcohol dehydrogenase